MKMPKSVSPRVSLMLLRLRKSIAGMALLATVIGCQTTAEKEFVVEVQNPISASPNLNGTATQNAPLKSGEGKTVPAVSRNPTVVSSNGELASQSVTPNRLVQLRIAASPVPTDESRHVEPAQDRASANLLRAEALFDASNFREALAVLDAGGLPVETSDLVQLRTAEASEQLGLRERTRAALSRSEIANSINRMVLVRAATLAERAGDFKLAADLHAKAAAQPTWNAERQLSRRLAAIDYFKSGQNVAAAGQLATLLELGGRAGDSGTELANLASGFPYESALVALLRQEFSTARSFLRQYLADAPNGEYATRARQRLATLEGATVPADADGWEAARSDGSAAAFRAWADAHPASARVPEARFQEGFAHYKAENYLMAHDIWIDAAVKESRVEPKARLQYWSGKALIMLGDSANARARWRTVSTMRPSNFYTVRAADRLMGVNDWPAGGGDIPKSAASSADEAEVDAWINQWAAKSVIAPEDALSLRRAELFSRMALERTAGAELDGLIESTTTPRMIYIAGRFALDRGLWFSATRAGQRLARLSPEKSPMDVPKAVRQLAYPSGYGPAVATESTRNEIGPLLLLSLMRQESLFDRYAVSTSNARGLTQVIPTTGAEIAKGSGITDFRADNLFEPNLSIAFGARYLAAQLKNFDGDVFRAIAAYNAGAGGARRWSPGVGDPDIYVESIEYSETREYVKGIYQHHAAYRTLLDPSVAR